MGQIFREHGDAIKDASRVINAETDIQIFIEHHNSNNPLPAPEIFEGQTDPSAQNSSTELV